MKRKMIERKCEDCQVVSFIRADSAGKKCSPCRARSNNRIRKPKDISNQKFGRLLALNISYIKDGAYWNCKCDCGNICIVYGARLRNGVTKSCGCIVETRKGLSTSPTYRTYQSMIQRCYDNKVPHYNRYGGKGITVCEEWRNSFEKFKEDMGERPLNKTIDRIDSSLGYFKENCRWLTPKEQAYNKKSGCFIEAFGQKLRLMEWAEKTGICWGTIRKRIFDLNWEPETALTKKVNGCHSKKEKVKKL